MRSAIFASAPSPRSRDRGTWGGVGRGRCKLGAGAHVMSSVEKLDTMLLMKFSRMMTARIAFQSVAFSPSSRQMDSSATFTRAGGLPMERTSTRCCFLMDFTAVYRPDRRVRHPPSESDRVRKRETKKAFLAEVPQSCGWRYYTTELHSRLHWPLKRNIVNRRWPAAMRSGLVTVHCRVISAVHGSITLRSVVALFESH